MPTGRPAILFMCVANSARSQIAEALARTLAPPGVDVFSAGSAPSRVHPFAIRVLEEIGIDSSKQYAKGVDQIPRARIGTVITLCSEDICPKVLDGAERLRWPFDDPVVVPGGDEEVLEAFRRVRDGIRARLMTLFDGGE